MIRGSGGVGVRIEVAAGEAALVDAALVEDGGEDVHVGESTCLVDGQVEVAVE